MAGGWRFLRSRTLEVCDGLAICSFAEILSFYPKPLVLKPLSPKSPLNPKRKNAVPPSSEVLPANQSRCGCDQIHGRCSWAGTKFPEELLSLGFRV